MSNTDFDAPTTAVDTLTGDYVLDASHSRLGFSVPRQGVGRFSVV